MHRQINKLSQVGIQEERILHCTQVGDVCISCAVKDCREENGGEIGTVGAAIAQGHEQSGIKEGNLFCRVAH